MNKIDKKLKHLTLVLFFCNVAYGQILFHQDQFRGGVTTIGFSTGQGTGSNNVNYFIEPGSIIKRAYLFSFKALDEPFHPIYINNQTINYSINDTVIKLNHILPNFSPIYILSQDISPIITNNTGTTLEIEIPQHEFTNNNAGVWCAFIYIEYENPALPLVNSVLWVNDQNYYGLENYSMQGMNPIDVNYPVGLSLMIDRACSDTLDGTIVRLNGDQSGLSGGDSLGIIGDNDASSINGCAGAKGHFYYQNNTLFALDDDTANFMMQKYDALADISPYLNQNVTGYDLTLRHQDISLPDNAKNVNVLFVNSYTSTCPEFNVTLNTTDTTVCKNEPLQLQVSGGNTFQWEPAEGLSCTDCPNPIASPENSTMYRLTVHNSDSCSKSIPVFVKVNEPPQITSLTTLNDTCGYNTGYLDVNAQAVTPLEYNLNGQVQSSDKFNGLAGGDYLLTVTDTNGCSADTIVNIPQVNLVRAGFTADPLIGEAPTVVNFTDESTAANSWIWYINGDTLFNRHPDYTFSTVDTFEVMQIAYYNSVECADTAYGKIKIFEPVQIQIPNIFTPNNDLLNDIFSVQLKGGEIIRWQIINRWGEIMYFGEKEVSVDQQIIDLWDGEGMEFNTPASDGVYFYKITVKSPAFVTTEYTGSFTLVR